MPRTILSKSLVNSFTLCLKPWHHSGLSMGNLRTFWFSLSFFFLFRLQYSNFFFFSFSTPVISQLSQTEVGFCDNIFASGVWYSIFYFLKLLTLISFFLTMLRKPMFDYLIFFPAWSWSIYSFILLSAISYPKSSFFTALIWLVN